MQVDSEDDFDPVDDFDMSDSEDEQEPQIDDTPASTPPSSSTPRCRQKTLKCPWDDCDKAFNRQARLTEHLRSHTNTRPFKCPHTPCTKSFLRDNHLKRHIKSAHSDVRDYKCTWEGCGAGFATGTRLRRHVEAHEAKVKFTCRGYPGCAQVFRKQETLDRHILSAHQNIKPFPCRELDSVSGVQCTKAYDTAENLRSHQRAKHDRSRYSCSECMAQNAMILSNSDDDEPEGLVVASFGTYGEFQAHIIIVHPPTCQYCPTSFTTNKELTRHLEIQHGVLPDRESNKTPAFPCVYFGCEKKFTKKGNLNVHIKTVHENKRDYVCGRTPITLPGDVDENEDVVVFGCNRSFTSKASLEEHVRTAHLGLESKRMIREKKRKADCDEDEGDLNILGIQERSFKKRRPRSDKGVRKSSAMAEITGAPADQVAPKLEASHDLPFRAAEKPDSAAQQSNAPATSAAPLPVEDEMSGFKKDLDEDDEDNYLSSSMTMCGSQIFHYDNSYHYPSGQYPSLENTLTHPMGGSNDAEPKFHLFGDFPSDDLIDCEVDDNFFGQFEPERNEHPYEYPML